MFTNFILTVLSIAALSCAMVIAGTIFIELIKQIAIHHTSINK